MEQSFNSYGSTGRVQSPNLNVSAAPPSGEYAVQTTVQSTRIVEVTPYFDVHYLTTFSGILKLIQLTCTFIAFVISVATWSSHVFYTYSKSGVIVSNFSSYAYGSSVWTDIVTSIAFLLTLSLLILYLFHIVEKYYQAPWLLAELLYCLAVGFCLMIAGAVMIPAYGDPARGAVVFFCWTAMIAYFVEAFLKFRAYRADESPQGI